MLTGTVHGDKPGTEDNLKESTQKTALSSSPVELLCVMNDTFMGRDAGL
jgi:hypothetical protein